jgi:ABC-type glycerol-3-phosphate transport system permease component
LILFLGRYMMRREDMAYATGEDGPFWRAVMTLAWPIRMLFRGIVALFWAINGVAETFFGAAARGALPGADDSAPATLQIQQIRDMFWPNPWSLEHFTYLFTQLPFTTWHANTILVALVSTLVSMFAASLAAYALVRLKWKGIAPSASRC